MKSKSMTQFRLARVAGAITLLACAALPLKAMAQTPAAPAAKAQPNNNVAQLEQKYLQLRNELGQIAAKAERSDPALIKQQEAFRKQLIAVMKKNGNDPQKMLDTFKSLIKQLQDKTLPPAKRQEIMTKLQQTQRALVAAERKAMQDPALQQARNKLEASIMAAMRKINPATDKMLAEMHALERQIMQARASKPQPMK